VQSAGLLLGHHDRVTARRDQPPDISEPEWPDIDPADDCGQRSLQGVAESLDVARRRGRIDATGEDREHRLAAQAAQRELQGRRRGGVQPLIVIDGDQHRALGCQRAQNAQHADGQRPRIGRALGAAQQRDGQGRALRRRQPVKHPILDVLEQVGQPAVGQWRLAG
jgi:hypothetical protein